MKHMLVLVVLAGIIGCLGNLAWADESGVLEVRGPDAAKKGYPIGKVEFLEVAIADQLVDIGDAQNIPLRLSVKYKVLETAPVMLNSRFGTEFWVVHNYINHTNTSVHTREDINLSNKGAFVAVVDNASADSRYGPDFSKGLCGIFGHDYFLIDQENGEWLDVVWPPPLFSDAELFSELVFTLADLSNFSLSFDEIQSTWEPGGPLRVKLNVTDANGEVFPVVNVAATVSAGGWQVLLQTQSDWLLTVTGWLSGELPADHVPEQITVRATVSAMTAEGPVQREVTGTFERDEGQATAAEIAIAGSQISLPRNEDGRARETRGLWVQGRRLRTREAIRDKVDSAAAARLNVLVPLIFERNQLLATSSLVPMWPGVQEGLDPLAEVIKAAHAKGLEVHPWFCVASGAGDIDATPQEWAAVDANGEFRPFIADLHSPDYQDYFVRLVVDVARNYDIDGIHLDYIRTIYDCYCNRCRQEFGEQFGKPLTEATTEDWVAWNQAAVGTIVRRVTEAVRQVKPEAMISAAVFVNLESGAREGQDPAAWARQGWVDLVMPMDYSQRSTNVRANEEKYLGLMDDDDKLVSGLCLDNRQPGRAALPRAPWLLKEQIELVRRLGIHGYCLFCDTHLSPEIIEMLSTTINREPAVPYFR